MTKPKPKQRRPRRDLIPDISARKAWGIALRRLREESSLSQTAAAVLVDWNQCNVSEVESGNLKTVRPYRTYEAALASYKQQARGVA